MNFMRRIIPTNRPSSPRVSGSRKLGRRLISQVTRISGDHRNLLRRNVALHEFFAGKLGERAGVNARGGQSGSSAEAGREQASGQKELGDLK